jgi:hypothetical protein
LRLRAARRAVDIGPSDAAHLRAVADEIDTEGLVELPGVDAARLRLLARKLTTDSDATEALRQHARAIHRALCDAIADIPSSHRHDPALFVFVPANSLAAVDALSCEAFSALAAYLLDEIE